MKFILLILFILNPPDKTDLDSILQKCKDNYAKVNDYSASLQKKELIKGKILEDRNIFFKFKKPQHFYMRWTEGEEDGVESLYVEGKYDNELIVNLNGWLAFLTVSIDPYGDKALKGNRHPVTEAELGHIIDLIDQNYQKAKKNNEGKFEFLGEESFDGIHTLVVRAEFPEGKEYYGHIIEIYFDKSNYLPVKTRVFGWKNEFLEEYYFKGLKINVGLTEEDFDKDNPEYGF